MIDPMIPKIFSLAVSKSQEVILLNELEENSKNYTANFITVNMFDLATSF